MSETIGPVVYSISRLPEDCTSHILKKGETGVGSKIIK